MKHYFVENPVSGKNNPIDIINELVIPAAEEAGIDYEVYRTKERGDGIRFVREKAKEANGEPVRFYSVGGDGTLYEVVNGAVGFDNVEITCIPKGSGNDYIRLYGSRDDFLDIGKMIRGTAVPVDGIKIEDGTDFVEYAINQTSMGFDAETCAKQAAMKKVPGAVGHITYLLAGLLCMITKVYNTFTCEIDGEPVPGPFIFAVGTASQWYGSGIHVAPFADPADGKLDLVALRRVTWWPVVFKVGMYDWQVKGTHVKKAYCEYLRGDKITFKPEKPVQINVDGECRAVTECTLTSLPGALKFVVPEGSSYLDPEERKKLVPEIEQGKWHTKALKKLALGSKSFDWIVNKGLMGYGRKRH